MWLVRNGTNYVRQSMQAEDLGIQASESQPARYSTRRGEVYWGGGTVRYLTNGVLSVLTAGDGIDVRDG